MTAIIHHQSNLPRKLIQHQRDVLYHGKPERNYMGKEYRKPKIVQKLWTDFHAAMKGPIPTSELRGFALEFVEREGRKPSRYLYPGHGPKRGHGWTDPTHGWIYLDILPGGDIAEGRLE